MLTTFPENLLPHACCESYVPMLPLHKPLSRQEIRLNYLSELISARFSLLREFLLRLKHYINFDSPAFCSRSRSPESFPYVVEFVRALHQAGMLSCAEIDPRRYVRCTLDPSPEISGFISGRWLERALQLRIARMRPDFAATNIHIRLENGYRTELDALIFHQNCLFWIEATTGMIDSRSQKMVRLAGELEIPLQDCILLTPDYEPIWGNRIPVYDLRHLEIFLNTQVTFYRPDDEDYPRFWGFSSSVEIEKRRFGDTEKAQVLSLVA